MTGSVVSNGLSDDDTLTVFDELNYDPAARNDNSENNSDCYFGM